MSDSQTTTDHDAIRSWVEQRGGVPATVEPTRDGDDVGVLRIDFPDSDGDDSELTTIAWEEFFAKFEDEKLAFLHQSETKDGSTSRFNKFVSR